MGPKTTSKKDNDASSAATLKQNDDFSQELIRQLNKEHGSNIAFNLASDDAPTEIKRWISTGSRQLDYIIGNRKGGGWAEGRIVEIQAPPGLGKSHLCFAAARSVQQMGGICVYVDTENATNIDNLADLGIDVSKRFVFVQSACTEETLSVIESTIIKARSMTKDVPVIVIWDSVSQSSPKAELEGDYDQNTIGLQARVLSKGMRKIANVIANQKVLLMLVSQQRVKIGVMYGDPCVSPDTSIRIRRRIMPQKDRNIWKMNNEKYTDETITFKNLATRLGIEDLDTPAAYDIRDDGYEILSYDEELGKETWQSLEAFVVKKNASEHYQLNTLHGTADHKVLLGKEYVRLADHPGAELINQPIQVVDCQVANTHNYVAEGQINHNTTTSGGMAIPYSSSTRIKLTGGKQLEKDGKIVGIEVTAKTIKNKVARPFRECTFQIHFGVGIREHEQIFDFLREHCEKSGPAVVNGCKVSVEGVSAWKLLSITKDGKTVYEKKFNKSNFDEILEDKNYKPYLDGLMDEAYIMKPMQEEHSTLKGVNSESVEEVQAADSVNKSAGDIAEA